MRQNLPDVDTLRTMAEQDPDALESLRKRLTDAVIAKARPSNQGRLRGLQAQIDMHRRAAKNPVDACLRISDMMQNAFGDLNASMQRLEAKMPADADNDLRDLAREVKDVRNRTASMSLSAQRRTEKTRTENDRPEEASPGSRNANAAKNKLTPQSARTGNAISKQTLSSNKGFPTQVPTATVLPFKPRQQE